MVQSSFERVEEKEISTEIGRDLAKARALLERGLVVAIPTETVYGLAANALDADAVAQIFEIKNRPFFDPLIVHGPSRDALSPYVSGFPAWADELARRFWPGPLTLVLNRNPSIPDLVTAGQEGVAVRVPAHPMTLDLLSQLDFPLAAPSANPFGYVSPTTPEHVREQLGGKIPYILDGGTCAVGLESTIVAEVDGAVRVLRLGGVVVEEIEKVLGPVEVATQSVSNPQTPGLLESHYAPRTPLIVGRIQLGEHRDKRVGLLVFQKECEGVPCERQVVLSRHGDMREAAKNLFAAMRYLDSLDLDVILAEEMREVGLGRAMNDRLRRASSKRSH